MKILQMHIQEGMGVIFGLFLFFIWLILLTIIKFSFFSEVSIVDHNELVKLRISGQAIQWLSAGVIPIFIIAGHYLLYSNKIDGIEKTSDIMAMKSLFVGFIIWLILCVITDLLKMNIPFMINIGGGYLIMFIIYLICTPRR